MSSSMLNIETCHMTEEEKLNFLHAILASRFRTLREIGSTWDSIIAELNTMPELFPGSRRTVVDAFIAYGYPGAPAP